jgi:hypothetical protein
MRIKQATVLGLALCLLLSGATFAGPAPNTHDGFLLRMTAGFGGASTKAEEGSNELKMDGPAGYFELAIGGMVSNSLALHGTLFGWSIEDPHGELSDATDSIEGDLNGTLSLGALGVGITNYFDPSNLYLSATIGVGGLNLDIDGLGDADSDAGFAAEILLGKEWWVGDNWGIGLAGLFGFHSIASGDPDLDANSNGGNFAILFSATFN